MLNQNRFDYLYGFEGLFHKFLKFNAFDINSNSFSQKTKVTLFELNVLNNTLIRLIEDFKLKRDGKKLIYVIDSSEYQGYVDPNNEIVDYIFNLPGIEKDKETIDKLSKWRKYRYEVLFGMKSNKSSYSEFNLFHYEHIREIADYKLSLLKMLFDKEIEYALIQVLDSLGIDFRKVDSKEDIIDLIIEKIKSEHKYINVFNEFVKTTKLVDRFDDLKLHGNYKESLKFDWLPLVKNDQILANKIKQILYDVLLYDFFYKSIESLNLTDKRKISIQADLKALSFVCGINKILKDNDIHYRIAFLTSSKFINVYTMYLFDFLPVIDNLNQDVTKYFRDIIYVRYPALFVSNAKSEEQIRKHEDTIQDDLLPVIQGLINRIKSKEPIDSLESELIEINKIWSELRDNYFYEENITDVVEQDSLIDNGEIYKQLKNIGFEYIYNTFFKKNKKIISELVDTYLEVNLSRLAANFNGRMGYSPMHKQDKLRYYIKSDSSKTSQYVFQIPFVFIENKIFIKKDNQKIAIDIEKILELQVKDKILYDYACILFSCMLRDWNIVYTVSLNFLNFYSSENKYIDLIEEVHYFKHLSLRYKLLNDLKSNGFYSIFRSTDDRVARIDNGLASALKINPFNPRLNLCLLSFSLEKAIIHANKIKFKAILHSPQENMSNQALEFLIGEYKTCNMLKRLKIIFEKHYFGNNLFLMYYKIMLSAYIFCKTSIYYKDIIKEDETLDEFYNQLKHYSDTLNKRGNDSVFFILKSVESIKENKLKSNDLREIYNNLSNDSFIKRFIFTQVLDHFHLSSLDLYNVSIDMTSFEGIFNE